MYKRRAIIAFIFAICLCATFIFLFIACFVHNAAVDSIQIIDERLSGDELRGMMNEAKLSPGLSDVYANEHPDFAWLFDGTFVTYCNKDGETNGE